MGIFGSALGGAIGIGAGIFGGISASKAMKKVKKNLQSQKDDNEDWYNRRYYEDSTQRADAQRVLTALNDNLLRRNQSIEGAQAVMGGTAESAAAARAANNEAVADAASRIAVNGERRKDSIEGQYMERKSALNDKLNNMEVQKANAMAQAVRGAGQLGASMGDMF